MHPTYRADIDGLRAIAVGVILLFHVGIPGFGGGYVGVDVFYVISGYLITTILAAELSRGEFSIRRFYLRRIRRIFPALFLMLAVSVASAWFLLIPKDMQLFGASLTAAAAFFANVQAWMQAGYFDGAADTKPLLHTWSLAVEEQFYMVFPLLLWLIIRRKWPVRPLVWLLFAVSLAFSIHGVRVDADATFYLLPTRAWELLIGSLIALGAVPVPKRQGLREGLAALGLLLILVPVFSYDLFTRFPGETALLPCLGAGLVILSGNPTAPTATARLLGLRPVVFVGLISYSLYLWHWPLIVYAHQYLVRPFAGWEKAGLIAGSLLLAVLSWRFIETPLRRGGPGRETFKVFGAAAAGIALLVATGQILQRDGFPGRYSPLLQRLFDQIEAPDHSAFAALKDNPAYAGFAAAKEGFIVGKGGAPEIVIWGDSHVGMMLPVVTEAITTGRIPAVTIFTKGGCRPVPGTYIAYDADLTCHAHNDAVLAYLKASPERRVILISRWGISLFGDVTPEGTGLGRPSLAASPGVMMTPAAAKALLADRLGALIDALVAAGKEVVLVEPFAEIPFEGKRRVFRDLLDHPDASELTVPMPPYAARYSEISALFDAMPQVKKVHRIAPIPFMCPNGRCTLYRDGIIHFADNNHLTWEASKTLVPLFEGVLR